MSDKIELLPCPFCGSAAKLQQRETQSLWSHNQVTFSQVGCCECQCVGEDCCEDDDGSEASAAWNTRAATSQQPAPTAVPDGWQLVPVEMTPEMVDVALKWGTKRSEWAELLTAAPAAPEPAAQEPIKLSDDVRDFLTAWISSALEDDDREFARQLETLLGPLYTAPPAAEQPDSARSILTDEDMHRLRRFQEICEDSDACGHDLPKEAVKWLERAGALRSCGFGRHEVTLFGDYLLGKESEA